MKTLHYSIIGISLLVFVISNMSEYGNAYTCAVNAPSLTTRYYYLHSDSVFVGTVVSITNNTNHQYDVKFDLIKSWKGSQHPKITTYHLVACGYSLVKGEKYLVFTVGDPPDYFDWATKPISSAQEDITLLDNPKFQTQAESDMVLYKKLVNARDALSNLMGSKMSKIPISFAGINDLNFTLDIGIADKKASLPSGAQEYKQKLEKIVGDVPIKVQYSDYVSALPEIISSHQKLLSSPLKQFKSGIVTKDVKCNDGFQRVIKSEDDHPACVKPSSVARLLQQGWMLEPYVDWSKN